MYKTTKHINKLFDSSKSTNTSTYETVATDDKRVLVECVSKCISTMHSTDQQSIKLKKVKKKITEMKHHAKESHATVDKLLEKRFEMAFPQLILITNEAIAHVLHHF